MQGQYQIQLKEILQKLHFNSIDELLQIQTFSTDKIASRCNLHTIVVEQYLIRLHQIALKTQLLQKKIFPSPLNQQFRIQFSDIFPSINFHVEQGQLLQILGRANGGKTTLMINIIIQALKKNIQPILLSSSIFCTQQYLNKIPKQKLMCFHFEDISQLAILIHTIGNQILKKKNNENEQNEEDEDNKPKKFILVIDCLSQIQQEDQSIQFDCSEKFRRLINTFTVRTQTSIIYSYRVNNSLFQTQFKRDHHRPKCKNSKQWDGWANKNVMIDCMTRKKDGKVIARVAFPKSLDNKLYEIIL